MKLNLHKKRSVLLFGCVLVAAVALTDNDPATFHLGELTIENISQQALIFRESPSFGAAVFDANKDSFPDLLVSNHGNPPSVFLNRGGRTFEDVSRTMLRLQGSDRHSPLLADYDNDGDQDLLIMHGAHDGTGLGPNEFFVNPGIGKPFVPVPDTQLADPKGRGRVGIWFDYDQDGLLDIYLVNKNRPDGRNRLFRNEGGGRFKDASAGSGLNVILKSEGGAIAGDIDNDKDMDLLVNDTWNRPRLFINQGSGVFREEGFARGLPAHIYNWSFGMADYDDDGFLDIYISGGLDATTGEGALLASHRLNFLHRVSGTADSTDSLSFACDPGAVLNFEFDKHVVDSENLFIGASGYNPHLLKFSVGPGAISADGRPIQWKADGSRRGTFIWRDASNRRIYIATASGGGFLRAGALVETQGILSDLDTTGMEHSFFNFPNFLLRNRGNGTFQDVTAQTNANDPSNSRSPLWVDFDNDTDLDLFVVNAGYNGPGKQDNSCYVNRGNGTFARYPVTQGPYEKFGRGDCGLVADFNKDGLEDLFIVNGSGLLPANKGPYQLFLNRTQNSNNWIQFRLIGAGAGYTNKDGIGARIALRITESPAKTSWRYILGGSGSSCQSSRLVHFGLGAGTSGTATVFWPPGKHFPKGHVQTFSFSGAQLNQTHVIQETLRTGGTR